MDRLYVEGRAWCTIPEDGRRSDAQANSGITTPGVRIRSLGSAGRFYRQCGPDAWRSGKVPQRITSNGDLADLYASVTAAFLRDWSRGGGNETPLILEVGGGSGLFAWLRLARFDAHSARRCLPHLMHIVEEGDPFDRKTMGECLLEVYRCELPESDEESLDTHIVFLFMKAKMYQETVQLLTMSMLETGRSAERLYLLAVAANRLGRKEEASRLLFEILEGDPNYWTAMRGADGTLSELVEWLLAVDEDDLHLDHMVLRASVAAFSRLDTPKQSA